MALPWPWVATILLRRPKLLHGYGRSSSLPMSFGAIFCRRPVPPLPGYSISPLEELWAEVTPDLY